MELVELFEQNPWWKDKALIERDVDVVKWNEKRHKWLPEIIGQIDIEPFALHFVLGPRQAGKTTALKLLVKKLLGHRDARSIFYFNCENLSGYKEVSQMFDLYLEFRESNSLDSSVIVLDEITAPKEWYRAVKFYIDKGAFRKDVLIITGSSSIAVKKEVELFPGRRGNGKDFVLYPLSFRGFLQVVDKPLADKIPRANNLEDLNKYTNSAMLFEKELEKHLAKYMGCGGFPISVANLDSSKDEAKQVYLSWVKNAVLKAGRSDVVARQILKVLVESLQSDVSWEGIAKKMEIKSPKTVAAYIDLLKSIFALNVLYNLDLTEKTIRFAKNKKIHFRDPLLLEIFQDWGMVKCHDKQAAVAESLVVEHLQRMFPERVFFWRNGSEVDAVVTDKGKLHGFEVKWSENPDAKKPAQLSQFTIVTKRTYSNNPLKIPLAVFLAMLPV